ncbi:hypothetical protein TYRP_002037 [Tyrophagus putrescentiae]|nr:hypothetical protein TYRP_002037 [Tyrophagus putrescentiae]
MQFGRKWPEMAQVLSPQSSVLLLSVLSTWEHAKLSVLILKSLPLINLHKRFKAFGPSSNGSRDMAETKFPRVHWIKLRFSAAAAPPPAAAAAPPPPYTAAAADS